MVLLLTILLALAFIIIAIIKFDIHPFLALFVGAIGYGLLAGMPGKLILQSIEEGFGAVLGKNWLSNLAGSNHRYFFRENRRCICDCPESTVIYRGKVSDARHDDYRLDSFYTCVWRQCLYYDEPY
jgi:hypothetical protein